MMYTVCPQPEEEHSYHEQDAPKELRISAKDGNSDGSNVSAFRDD